MSGAVTTPSATHPSERRQLIGEFVSRLEPGRLAFLFGAGAVAVHIADDNFVQPQPGTSAADHLASGLIPLAILVALATAYPRLRVGTQAAIVIPLGLLGIVAGAGEA